MKYNINRNVNIVSQYEYIVRSISRIKTKFVRYDIINIPRSFPTEFVVVSSRRDPRVRLSRTVSCHEARGTVRLLINGRKSVGKKEEKGRSGDDLTEGGGGRESVVESPGKSIITRRTMRGRGAGERADIKGWRRRIQIRNQRGAKWPYAPLRVREDESLLYRETTRFTRLHRLYTRCISRLAIETTQAPLIPRQRSLIRA